MRNNVGIVDYFRLAAFEVSFDVEFGEFFDDLVGIKLVDIVSG